MPLDKPTKDLLAKYLLDTVPMAPGKDLAGATSAKGISINLRQGTPEAEIKKIQEGIARWFAQTQTPVNINGGQVGAELGNVDINNRPQGVHPGIDVTINPKNIDRPGQSAAQTQDYITGLMPTLQREIQAAKNPAPALKGPG